jgi:glycosyltransferase involved in cell wall biosynthesis
LPENRPLLSIYIPTFNRAECLFQCLKSFIPQIDEKISRIVEIIVNDNASTDATQYLMSILVKKYPFIHYSRNETNIGPERNVIEPVRKARGEYAWVFGDDDLILDGALNKLLPYLLKGEFDFFMTNKVVKNNDLTKTILDKQSNTATDITFHDIKDLCCEFGFYTNFGFLSTAIFRRQPFAEVDPDPYIELHSRYPQNGIFLEAFSNQPCLYISDVIVCHRQFNSPSQGTVWPYIGTTPLVTMMKILVSKQKVEYSFVEQIKEEPLLDKPCTIVDIILDCFGQMVRRGYAISEVGFADALEMFRSFKSEEYKKRFGEIYSQYKTTSRASRFMRRMRWGIFNLYTKIYAILGRVPFLVRTKQRLDCIPFLVRIKQRLTKMLVPGS